MGGLARSTTARMQPVGGREERALGAAERFGHGHFWRNRVGNDGGVLPRKMNKRPHNVGTLAGLTQSRSLEQLGPPRVRSTVVPNIAGIFTNRVRPINYQPSSPSASGIQGWYAKNMQGLGANCES